jgi:adenine/guanine phosphoribosyltransferase-like PRPP-binding protein
MLPTRETYQVDVAGITRKLPLFEVAPGLRIAVLNILGDTELVQACAQALSDALASAEHDLLATAEAKSIPLIHALAAAMGDRRYIVLRKAYKPYMGETLKAETVSITTGAPQTLYLDEKDRKLVEGSRVILIDDVISTGSTLKGMRELIADAGGKVVREAAIFTEGDPDDWKGIISLGHLPLFKDGA